MDNLIAEMLDLYEGDTRALALQSLIDENNNNKVTIERLEKKLDNNRWVIPMLVAITVLPVITLLTLLIGTSVLPTSILLGIVSITSLQIIIKLTKSGN